MTEHVFRVDDGKEYRDGKACWPDSIRIETERFYAWEMVQRLVAQLRFSEQPHATQEKIVIDLPGKLEAKVGD